MVNKELKMYITCYSVISKSQDTVTTCYFQTCK